MGVNERETTLITRTYFEYCPKCGCYHPRFIKSDFANSDKQMLRCKECVKRFVVDRDQLTFYSHKTNLNGTNLS